MITTFQHVRTADRFGQTTQTLIAAHTPPSDPPPSHCAQQQALERDAPVEVQGIKHMLVYAVGGDDTAPLTLHGRVRPSAQRYSASALSLQKLPARACLRTHTAMRLSVVQHGLSLAFGFAGVQIQLRLTAHADRSMCHTSTA